MLRLCRPFAQSDSRANLPTPFEYAMNACSLDDAIDRHGFNWNAYVSMTNDTSGRALFQHRLSIAHAIELRIPVNQLRLCAADAANTGLTLREWATAYGLVRPPHTICACDPNTMCAITGWSRELYSELYLQRRRHKTTLIV
ncbi:hypothetical protein CYMTET_2602 [Cymbomonas tetramitiformis]|uniref:Uncharacterized protein n=1 Tax=Cymbomonas tetramitiformis TaxID=36881 RepID=A0AAE0LMD7_9CHLO|nr:hypothetical protein CYMTET_2602 [Cymbomonas tetramitiformis]